MEKFGNVDFVLADVSPDGRQVREFVSVELQAVDITGSYVDAYESVTNNRVMEKRPTYGFNWGNVRKRFLTQLRDKGMYHHHWRTRIAAIMQEDNFDQICEHGGIASVPKAQSNIVFLLYQFEWSPEGRWEMRFKRAVPTTHAELMMASLYEDVPDKSAFKHRILEQASN